MKANVGDRIAIETEKVGSAERHGEVREVIEAEYGTRYRVAWDDGHESIVHPTAGAMRILPEAPLPNPG